MAKSKNNASPFSKLLYFVVTFFFLVIFDSYFSDLIIKNINSGIAFRTDYFALNYVQNTGAAFNILEGNTLLLIILSSVAIIILNYYVINNLKKISMVLILSISFLLAGIFCNLYERISLGFVRDFFEITFVNFPIFNISDIFINIGVIMIIWLVIKKKVL